MDFWFGNSIFFLIFLASKIQIIDDVWDEN